MAEPCTDCIKGTVHRGKPQGTIEEVHGLQTYITGNRKTPRATIVMYSDVFGLELINNKLIADAYAKSGEYLVYMADFFEGDPVSLSNIDLLIPLDASKQSTLGKYTGLLAFAPGFVMWLTRHKFGQMEKVCNDFLSALRRATPRNHKIGMVGFCWGGRYAMRAGLECNRLDLGAGEKVPLIDAVVILHPSNLSLPDDANKPIVPISIGWGLEDSNTPIKTKDSVEAAHNANRKESGKELPKIEHRVYTPGRHGFAVRGNPDDPEEKKLLEDSITHVLDWFGRYL